MILTLAVPPDRRVSVDLPETFIPGSMLRLEINPGDERDVRRTVSLMDLYGSCEGEDTLDAYFERKRADKKLEEKRLTPSFEGTGA